jgi:hypothetical protein
LLSAVFIFLFFNFFSFFQQQHHGLNLKQFDEI